MLDCSDIVPKKYNNKITDLRRKRKVHQQMAKANAQTHPTKGK